MNSNRYFIFAILFSFCTSTFSQEVIEKEKEPLNQSYFDQASTYWTKTGSDVIPEKWNQESGVILYRYLFNSYKKVVAAKKIVNKDVKRVRVLLNDQAAINQYSDMSFDPFEWNEEEKDYFFGVKIIKPSGKEEIIDLNEAVDVEVNNKVVGKRLAIPNLSKGDIIDYFYVESYEFDISKDFDVFYPKYQTLVYSFPIKEQKIEFNILRKCYFNLKSLNGAPEVIKSSSDNEEYDTYSIVQKDVEKTKDTRWVMDCLQLPVIKYQVAFARSARAMKGKFFGAESGKIKSSVSKQELLDFTLENVNAGDVAEVKAFVKDRYNEEVDDPELLLVALQEYYRQNSAMGSRGYNYIENTKHMFSAINFYLGYFENNDIKSSVLVLPRKHLGSIDEVICVNDIKFMVKVSIKGKDYWMYPLSNFRAPMTKDPELSGVKGYQLVATPVVGTSFSTVETPKLSASENSANNVIKTSINANDDFHLNMSSKSYYTGIQRMFLHNVYPFDLRELNEYGSVVYKTQILPYNYIFNYRNNMNQENGQTSRYTWSKIYRDVESDYNDEIKDLDFSVTESGVSYLRPKSELFLYGKLQNYIKKVNGNYVIDIGKLIGSQAKIKKDEEERSLDIYYNGAAREFVDEIHFRIPAGFKIVGLEGLKSNYESSVGIYEMKSEVKDGELIVYSSKKYKHEFENASNWLDIKEFLDAAWQASQKKVLLKKI